MKRAIVALLGALPILHGGFAAALTPRPVELIVLGGTVVTMDKDRRVIRNGAVAIDKGEILAVGTAEEVEEVYTSRNVQGGRDAIVIPGLVNTHGHAPMVLFRGIADDLRLMDWLQKYIFPAEKKNVTAAFVRTGTRLAALEMIRSGTTTFADMYYFEDQVAEAAKEAGLRAVAGETVIGFPAPDNATTKDTLAYTERFLARWKGDPLVTAAVAPHSTYLTSPEDIQASRALADRYGAPLLIHLSESPDEQRHVRERYGKTPAEHLRDLGVLRKGVVAAHGVWLTPGDRAILERAEVGVAHCPQSNMKIASGTAPVADMLKEGLRLGLGTDGAASNNDLDMFEEMLTAALLAKHSTGDPTNAPAAAVLEMATLGGARALGMEDRIGSLEAGRRADLVVVGLGRARATPVYDPVSHLVYAAKGADVRQVVVEGRVLLDGGRVTTLDEAAVIAEANRIHDQIRRSLATP